MPTISQHLSDRIVPAGAPLELAIELDNDEGVTYTWQHQNTPVAGATSKAHQIDRVSTAHAGTWTVVAATSSTKLASTATIVVLDPAPDPEPEQPPLVWRAQFAATAASALALITILIGLPLWWRAWSLRTAAVSPASADATIIAATVATLGIMLLASATFMILVEVRGRASDPPAPPAGDIRSLTTTKAPADVSPDGVAKVIDALGKLGTVQLLAVGGLIALAIAGMLGWRIATPPDDDPTTAPTPTATTTPETNPPG